MPHGTLEMIVSVKFRWWVQPVMCGALLLHRLGFKIDSERLGAFIAHRGAVIQLTKKTNG